MFTLLYYKSITRVTKKKTQFLRENCYGPLLTAFVIVADIIRKVRSNRKLGTCYTKRNTIIF